MKALSLDIRQKIIETYENEPISQREIARRFRVATSVVTRLIKQYRETGNLEPKPRPGRSPALTPAQLQQVKVLVEAAPDSTLDELAEALHEQIGIKVSRSTMCRVMKQLGFTRKKKPFTPKQRKMNRCSKPAASTGMP